MMTVAGAATSYVGFVGRLQTYTFMLDVQSEHLPEFLGVFASTDSWISAFTVLAPKAGQLMNGALFLVTHA